MENVTKFTQLVRVMCIEPMKIVERHISTSLQEANVKIRPSNSNGLWCHILLPLVLTTYSCLDNVSTLYKITSCISVGLFFHSVLFILFLSTSSMVLKEPVYTGCIASGFMSTVLLCVFLQTDLWFSLTVSILSTWLYASLLRLFILKFDKTFTLGEAMITAQAAVLFFMMSVIKFFFEMKSDDEEMEFIAVIVYTILSTVGLIVTVLYVLTDSQRTLKTLAYIVALAAVFVLIILHDVLGSNCVITIILNYVFVERDRYRLLMLWLALVLLAAGVVLARTRRAARAGTAARKTFHVLASVVFLSGVVYDVCLMTLAAGIGFGVLIFVEALRKSGIQPISSALQSAFLVYCDEKDVGVFAMTPVYLYVGLACPLLLVPGGGHELELLSGVLSIGVGDTAASWFGSRFGVTKWPDSNRTMEGTAFNILSQIGTVYALQLFELLDSKSALSRTVLAATVSGLVEANTDQVDNLVLPLVTIIAFQATRILM